MVYAMWTPGDKLPETTPKDCEFLYGNHNEWNKVEDHPSLWNHRCRRWPVELPEQRPTAFGLLSVEEQEELRKAVDNGKTIQFLDDSTVWVDAISPLKCHGWIYRIKPEPQQPEITVTVNGELIDFRELVRQEIARIQGE